MICRRCGEDKPLDDYYVDKNGYRRKICKECAIKQSRANVIKAGEKRKAYEKQYHKAHRDKRQEQEREYKQKVFNLKTPCIKCGESRLYVLDFHHINPADKSFNINRKSCRSNFDVLVKEVSKCVSMCRNCHAEYHYIYGQMPDDPVGTLEEYIGRRLIDVQKLKENDCKVCNTFNEYFEHLSKSGMEKGVTGIEDEDKLFILNVALATTLTILQGKEETIVDYFA